MTSYKLKKEIIKRLSEKGIDINLVKIRGYNKDTKNIKSVLITLNDLTSGDNILYEIKRTLDEIEDEFGFCTSARLLDF